MGSSCIGTSEVVYTEVELTEIIVLPALRQARTEFYFGLILPFVAYGMLVCGSCTAVKCSSQNLEPTHVRTAKVIFNLDWCTLSKEVLATAKWNTLEIMYEKRLLILTHQAYYHLLSCPMN